MSEIIQYIEEKEKCKELCEELYNKVGGKIDIKSLTYAVYPKIVDWKTKKPLWNTVLNWVTGIWVQNNWKTVKDEDNEPIVYGIIYEGKLIYIGKTARSLELRKYEHEQSESSEIDKFLFGKEGYEFVILATAKSDYEASVLEKRMINLCKPRFNKEGKDSSYKFKLTKEGEKQRRERLKEIVEEVDDIEEFLRLYLMKERIDLWRVEDEAIEGIHREPIEINFEIGKEEE